MSYSDVSSNIIESCHVYKCIVDTLIDVIDIYHWTSMTLVIWNHIHIYGCMTYLKWNDDYIYVSCLVYVCIRYENLYGKSGSLRHHRMNECSRARQDITWLQQTCNTRCNTPATRCNTPTQCDDHDIIITWTRGSRIGYHMTATHCNTPATPCNTLQLNGMIIMSSSH